MFANLNATNMNFYLKKVAYNCNFKILKNKTFNRYSYQILLKKFKLLF